MNMSTTLSWKKIGLRLVALFMLGFGIAYLALSDRGRSSVSTEPAAVAGSGVPPVDPASIGTIVKDEETGREFLSNQVIVEFTPEISEEAALEIIAKHGGKMLQRFTAAPVFLVQVADNGDGGNARATVRALRKDARVKNAELNYLTTLERDS